MKKKQFALKRSINTALQDWGSHQSWEAIHALRCQASPQLIQRMCRFTNARNWRKRALAINVMSQLFTWKRRYGNKKLELCRYAEDESPPMLLNALDDPCLEVMISAIYGFGHRHHFPAMTRIVALSSHPSAEVRHAAAFALGKYKQDESIQALICLARDIDDEVRDWATFSLGSLSTIDTEAVRESLWCNIDDKNENVRAEALAGLARRKDARIIELLKKRLQAEDCMIAELEAAEAIADSTLYPLLKNLYDRMAEQQEISSYWLSCLNDAMEACSPDKTAKKTEKNA